MKIRLRPALAIMSGAVCVIGFTGLSASAKTTANSGWRLSAEIAVRGKVVIMQSVAAVNAHSAWAAGLVAKQKPPGGEAVIEHWSGRGWKSVKVPGKVLASFDRELRGYAGPPSVIIGASSDRNVWVFNQLTGAWMRWDGLRWRAGKLPVQVGSTGLVFPTEVVIAGNDSWALGGSESAKGQVRPYAARFNGRRWITTAMPSGLDLPVSGGSAVSADDIWATVGYVGQAFFPPQGNGGAIVHWNGRRWQRHPLPPGIGTHGDPTSVLAVSDNDIWVGGGHPDKSDDLTETAERWNGSSWRSTAPSVPRAYADCVFRGIAGMRTGLLGLTDCFRNDTGRVSSRFWTLSSGRWVGPRAPHLAGGVPAFLDLAATKGSGPMWAVGYLGREGVIVSCVPAHC